MRDLLAVLFRQRRLLILSFLAVLLACFSYWLLTPAYRAEMNILVSRRRVDPAVTPSPEQVQFERDEVTEDELNSEVDLLRDRQILRTVAQAAGLFPEKGFSLWKFLGESDEQRLDRTVRRLRRSLNVEPVSKTTLITVSYASSNPEQAATVLKCLAGAYLERHSLLHRPAGETNFFEQQIVEAAPQFASCRAAAYGLYAR